MATKARKDIILAFGFIWDHNVASGLGASPADVRASAYGYVLGIPVVTDDKDMLELGEMFSVEMIRIIDLIELMYKSGHIDKSQIDSLVQHLVYDNDLPSPSFVKDCEERFS